MGKGGVGVLEGANLTLQVNFVRPWLDNGAEKEKK